MKRHRKTTKPKRKPYRFTLLLDRDKELIEYLDSIPKPLRGIAIMEALKLQVKTFTVEKQDEKRKTVNKNLGEEPLPEFKGTFDF